MYRQDLYLQYLTYLNILFICIIVKYNFLFLSFDIERNMTHMSV